MKAAINHIGIEVSNILQDNGLLVLIGNNIFVSTAFNSRISTGGAMDERVTIILLSDKDVVSTAPALSVMWAPLHPKETRELYQTAILQHKPRPLSFL